VGDYTSKMENLLLRLLEGNDLYTFVLQDKTVMKYLISVPCFYSFWFNCCIYFI